MLDIFDGGGLEIFDNIFAVPVTYNDDVPIYLGTDKDIVTLNRSTILNANTALTGVLIGTPVAQAIAANSFMLSDVTASGDLAFYVNKGSHSQMVFWADGSSGDTAIMAATGQSVDVYIAGAKEYDIAAGAFTAGADTNGIDLKFFGDVTNSSLFWDASGEVLVIDQGATSTNVIQLLSTGLVAHGATTLAPTNAWGFIKKLEDNGGLRLAGFKGGASALGALVLQGYLGTDVDTTKSTAGRGIIEIQAYQLTGTGVDNVVANGNVLAVRGWTGGTSSTLLIIDINGNVHATDFIAGMGEGGSVALTGGNLRAPDLAAGTNQAGADLTISAGKGTGTGDVGQLIFQTPRVGSSGVTVQTLTTLVTMDEATITAGADTSGADLKIFGDITASYIQWDASEELLTIDQGATVTKALNFAATGVLATALTTATTPDVATADWGVFGELATTGGLKLLALGTDAAQTTNMVFESWGGTADTTKTTAGRALVEIYVTEHNGANAIANVTANGNVFGVRARVGGADVMLLSVDEDGDVLTNGGITTGSNILSPNNTPLQFKSAAGAARNILVLNNNNHVYFTNQDGYIVLQTLGASALTTRVQFTSGANVSAIEWQNSYHTGLKFGLAGTATGSFRVEGATSGAVTVTVGAVAGTWTMTLPAAVGAAGYFLVDAAGNGVTSWSNLLPAITGLPADGVIQTSTGANEYFALEAYNSTAGNRTGMLAIGVQNNTAAGARIGFFGVTPAVKPSAYTQTYTTADKTIANPTCVSMGDLVATTGGWGASSEANFDKITAAVDQIIADNLDLRQGLTALIDDLQTLGLVG